MNISLYQPNLIPHLQGQELYLCLCFTLGTCM